MALATQQVVQLDETQFRYLILFGALPPALLNYLATSERYKDKSGEQQEKTEWHNIVAWRQLAEICGKYLHKGKQVYIEGRIQTRSYDDRDGNKKYITEIVADQMQMLGRVGEDNGGYSRPAGESRPSRPAAQSQTREDYAEPPFNPDDDIPF
jgi:single-strand DNA-binding protein